MEDESLTFHRWLLQDEKATLSGNHSEFPETVAYIYFAQVHISQASIAPTRFQNLRHDKIPLTRQTTGNNSAQYIFCITVRQRNLIKS